MTGFFISAAVLIAVSLIVLLMPLLRQARAEIVSRTAINVDIYRDQLAELERDAAAGILEQADYEASRSELQRRLIEDAEGEGSGEPVAHSGRLMALVLGITLPVAAILLYLLLGSVDALVPDNAQSLATEEHEFAALVAALRDRLESNPDDHDGWVMLGRSYMYMNQYNEAVQAFAAAEEVVLDDPALLVEYAWALTMIAEGSLAGRPEELIARALELEPENHDALYLAGAMAYERQDFPVAIAYWERLLELLPPDSEQATSIADGIRSAKDAVMLPE